MALIRRVWTNPDDAAERMCVKNFMNLLEPHTSQLGALIYVYASASLLSITTDFKHMPSPIHTSTYLCDVHDNSVFECEAQMPSYIFMMGLD